MKNLIAITIALFVGCLATSAYAVQTTSATTTATVNVGSIFSMSFDPVGTGVRSTTAFSFKTVDGSMIKGWYYNALATLDASELPNDNKSDVALRAKSNVSGGFKIAVKQSNATYASAIGYYVKDAFDGGAPEGSPAISPNPVIAGTGFKGATTWGTLATTNINILNTTSAAYGSFGIVVPISFVLVPDGLSVGTNTTTITYTMTSNL